MLALHHSQSLFHTEGKLLVFVSAWQLPAAVVNVRNLKPFLLRLPLFSFLSLPPRHPLLFLQEGGAWTCVLREGDVTDERSCLLEC